METTTIAETTQVQAPIKRPHYAPDPNMTLADQARIFHGPRLAGPNRRSILKTAELLKWPVGCNRKATVAK